MSSRNFDRSTLGRGYLPPAADNVNDLARAEEARRAAAEAHAAPIAAAVAARYAARVLAAEVEQAKDAHRLMFRNRAIRLEAAAKGLTIDGAPLEVKANPEGRIFGYGSVFGVVDSFGDAVMPGAFSASLENRKPLMLWSHDVARPIGVWTSVAEDSKGLHVEGQLLPDVAAGREAIALVAAGAVTGLSIGFRTIRESFDPKSDVRRLEQVELYEVSLVSLPANDAARVEAIRGMEAR